MANMIFELSPVCAKCSTHQNDANPTHMHLLHYGLFLSHSYDAGFICLIAFLVSLLRTVLDLQEAFNHIPAILSFPFFCIASQSHLLL